MADKFSARMLNAQQGHGVVERAWLWAKPRLLVPEARPMILSVREETRSDLQNNWIHAVFGDVAKQAEWMGRRCTPVQWKTLFVSGHAIASGLGADVVPGLEGEFVNIRESTAQMSRSRCASLQTYMQAWCADNNVVLHDAREWEASQ